MPSKLKDLFKRSLSDLGEKFPEYAGIYSPHYDGEKINRFMTSHYTSLAEVREQAKTIHLTNYYYKLILEALHKTKFDLRKKQKLTILDLGCGFGSTTFPLLKIFPHAHLIASELSLQMLTVLKERISFKDKNRLELLRLNAEELDFKENSFDLICGAAILHHLFCPEETIKDLSKLLKPGGIAIFFEPFEEGMSIMALIYQTIIYHGRFIFLDRTTKRYFRNMVALWDKMRNMDKGDDFFQTVDDKWLFKKSYFQKYAQKNNLVCEIFRLDKSDKPYTHIYESHLGLKAKRLPFWIREIISHYEKWLSDEFKNELLTEGCIIFRK